MSEFISLIKDVLSIQLSLGGFDTNLGEVVFFVLIIRFVSERFFHEIKGNAMVDDRARKAGFLDAGERQAYDVYMAGGERHKDGKYY